MSEHHILPGISNKIVADAPVFTKVCRLSCRVSSSQLRIIITKRIIAGEFLNELCSTFERNVYKRNFRGKCHDDLFTVLRRPECPRTPFPFASASAIAHLPPSLRPRIVRSSMIRRTRNQIASHTPLHLISHTEPDITSQSTDSVAAKTPISPFPVCVLLL